MERHPRQKKSILSGKPLNSYNILPWQKYKPLDRHDENDHNRAKLGGAGAKEISESGWHLRGSFQIPRAKLDLNRGSVPPAHAPRNIMMPARRRRGLLSGDLYRNNPKSKDKDRSGYLPLGIDTTSKSNLDNISKDCRPHQCGMPRMNMDSFNANRGTGDMTGDERSLSFKIPRPVLLQKRSQTFSVQCTRDFSRP